MRRRQQLELARKSYWINKPAWTITELVFLINGYEPKLLDENIGIDETGVRAKLPDWLDWSPSCPGIELTNKYPIETPIDKGTLINWATGLSGVEIPDWIRELAEKPKNTQKNKRPAPLGDRGQENLYATIGALTLVIANAKDIKHGTLQTPNINNIAATCIETIGKVNGQGHSALRNRITIGLQQLPDKK